MYYVYFIRSRKDPSKRYVGYTTNIQERLDRHNSDTGSIYTAQYSPWELESYVAFKSKPKAIDFEKYMKTGSGQTLANKRFWEIG